MAEVQPILCKSFKNLVLKSNKNLWGAPAAHLCIGTLRVEIIEFHSTFSRHGNTQASLTLLIWLNEKVQKLKSKIYRAAR